MSPDKLKELQFLLVEALQEITPKEVFVAQSKILGKEDQKLRRTRRFTEKLFKPKNK